MSFNDPNGRVVSAMVFCTQYNAWHYLSDVHAFYCACTIETQIFIWCIVSLIITLNSNVFAKIHWQFTTYIRILDVRWVGGIWVYYTRTLVFGGNIVYYIFHWDKWKCKWNVLFSLLFASVKYIWPYILTPYWWDKFQINVQALITIFIALISTM